MIRAILLILIILIAFLFIKLIIRLWSLFYIFKKSGIFSFIRAAREHNKSQQQPTQDSEEKVMVKCAKCQLYVPRKEATVAHGKYYCSKQHSKG